MLIKTDGIRVVRERRLLIIRSVGSYRAPFRNASLNVSVVSVSSAVPFHSPLATTAAFI